MDKVAEICLEMDFNCAGPLTLSGIQSCPVTRAEFDLLRPEKVNRILGRLNSATCAKLDLPALKEVVVCPLLRGPHWTHPY